MASSSESEGENTPLWRDRPTTTVSHRDSVFSFALFMPALTRQYHGHYVTTPVAIAFMLFVITVTCQLSLTLIAGDHIQQAATSFKVSLVHHQDWHATAMTPVDWVSEAVGHAGSRVRTAVSGAPETKQCCDSAECVELYPCCGPREKVSNPSKQDGSTPNPHFFLAQESHGRVHLLKPAVNRSRFKNLLDDFVFGSRGDIALCRKSDDGLLDCTPPSYAYLDAWHELDDNGDGLWTLQEAEADRSNLGCRLGLSATDFFTSAVRGIIKDARDTADNSYAIPLVPQSIENREAIPLAYFEHFKGLAVICTAVDIGRCGQIVASGFFDGAIGLKSRATRGGINDLDSALDFCQRMLRPSGVCEQTLPHTYQLYRSRVREKCGTPFFEVGKGYVNPHDPRDAMSTVQVSYSQYSQYETAAQWQFQVFLALILMVWYITLVVELSRILELINLLLNLEAADHTTYSVFADNMESGLRSLSISSHTLLDPKKAHRAPVDADAPPVISDLSQAERFMASMMVVIRIFLWFYMANVGTTFLLATFGYDDLLFNAVALAFIFELPEFLYTFLVSDAVKEQLDGATSAEFPSLLPTGGVAAVLISRAFWGLVIIPIIVWMVCTYNNEHNIQLSLEALRCACYQTGDHCVASGRFNKPWWDQYWKDTFPLARLRSSYLA